jgi:hypothetical protein
VQGIKPITTGTYNPTKQKPKRPTKRGPKPSEDRSDRTRGDRTKRNLSDKPSESDRTQHEKRSVKSRRGHTYTITNTYYHRQISSLQLARRISTRIKWIRHILIEIQASELEQVRDSSTLRCCRSTSIPIHSLLSHPVGGWEVSCQCSKGNLANKCFIQQSI